MEPSPCFPWPAALRLPGSLSEVLWLWLTPLDQDVGILGSWSVAAQSLGHLQPWGKYR